MLITVVGNPGHRRIVGFAAAVRAAGLPAPRVVPWAQVLRGGTAADLAGCFAPGPVRLDSHGEDAVVRALLGGGDGDPTRVDPALGDPTRVEGGAVRYRTLDAALRRVADALRLRTDCFATSDPAEIAVMFDKRRAHAVLGAGGVPVPPALPPVHSYAQLRERMREAGVPRVFVKPAHGSSASGVVALQTAPGGRVVAVSSAELVRGRGGTVRLFNSLRLRRYSAEAEVAALVETLCPEELHVEEWLPKLSLADGRAVDLRVLVVAGRATHVVARAARGPMTNLHLGNSRVDVGQVRALVGEGVWQRAMDTCVRAAGCFPRTLHVGVDLLLGVDRRRLAVGEVNAFGDLLPGVLHRGRDTWGEQVRALVDGWRPETGAAVRVPCVPRRGERPQARRGREERCPT